MLQQRGFSLLELAISLLALSFLLTGTAQLLRVQYEQNALKETDRQLQLIREALLGFATLEHRLPCPAADELGRSDNSLCDAEGYLPWADLAIEGRDAWGSVFRYRIDENFALSIPNDLETHSQLSIRNSTHNTHEIKWTAPFSKDTKRCYKNNSLVSCSRVVAIFFSMGANKQADDRNKRGDATYAYDEYGNDFDDRLLWLGVSDLVGGMLRVGNWPLL